MIEIWTTQMQPLPTPSPHAHTLILPVNTRARVGCLGMKEDRWYSYPTNGKSSNKTSSCLKYVARVVLVEWYVHSTELPKRKSQLNKLAMLLTISTLQEKFSVKYKFCASSLSCAITSSRPRSGTSWLLVLTNWLKSRTARPISSEIQPLVKADSTRLCQNQPW